MRRLYRYLPPFAGDYSGVCSVLYELGGMICIHDAAGCTGNYTGFDEPRSYNSRTLIYCTGLRKTDAILGNEEVYVHKISIIPCFHGIKIQLIFFTKLLYLFFRKTIELCNWF